MERVVVRCDGAGTDIPTEGARVLEIASTGKDARNLRLQSLSDVLPAHVPDVANDLVRVAGYVYWADQMVSRGGNTDVPGDRWPRRFEVAAPVRDVARWSRPDVHEALQDVLNFGTGDIWIFRFCDAPLEAEQLRSRTCRPGRCQESTAWRCSLVERIACAPLSRLSPRTVGIRCSSVINHIRRSEPGKRRSIQRSVAVFPNGRSRGWR